MRRWAIWQPQRRVSSRRLSDPDEQRQYLSWKRSGVVPRWEDPDLYYADVRPDLHKGLHMICLDGTKPWGPENFRWGTVEEKVRHIHGTQLRLGEVDYASYEEAASAHGMSTSTLRQRMKVQGMSLEEAVSKPVRRRQSGQ